MPNRLGAEQSPYLLQHANNPVDWYPWGEDAFAAARAVGKPIFLSIGYATCHWCHVMERESFESHGVAKVLNDHFIAIKVDREERPDVDRVYMTFVQATTGAGGWPMSVWLTPDLQPFFGGTYFPPSSQYGRPGFVDVLTEINRAWRDDRPNVLKSATEIVARLAQLARGQDDRRTPDASALTSTYHQFARTFDTRRGGFGDAPKFPRPSELLFLLREHKRTGDTAPREMVVQTLRSLVFEGRYGVLPNGNAPFDPQHEFVNKNLLHTAQSIADVARASGKTPVEIAEILLRARTVLFDRRNLRPRPQLDDKVLTAWNGLMIAAFARAARVLGVGPHHLASAVRAATFIKQTMWQAATGRLLRRYRAGDAAIGGYAEDYAYLIFGVLELFQATGDAEWLTWARALQARQDELFWDAESGGWFSTTGADPSVLLRMKEDYDGAEPSPTAVSALNAWTLAHLTGEAAYATRAAEALASFGGRLEDQGRAVPFMAAVLSASLAGSEQIVIVGRRDAADTQALWRAAHQHYRPFAVMVLADPAEQAALAAHMPWVAEMKMIDEKATAYVCRDFACDAPSTDPSVFQ